MSVSGQVPATAHSWVGKGRVVVGRGRVGQMGTDPCRPGDKRWTRGVLSRADCVDDDEYRLLRHGRTGNHHVADWRLLAKPRASIEQNPFIIHRRRGQTDHRPRRFACCLAVPRHTLYRAGEDHPDVQGQFRENVCNISNKSRAIAGTTARCAQYMSAQIIM